jgi:hypothetical protein
MKAPKAQMVVLTQQNILKAQALYGLRPML